MTERERWTEYVEAMAAERGVTIEAAYVWLCREIAWEIDEDAPAIH